MLKTISQITESSLRYIYIPNESTHAYDLFKAIKDIEKTYDESNKMCLKDWIC